MPINNFLSGGRELSQISMAKDVKGLSTWVASLFKKTIDAVNQTSQSAVGSNEVSGGPAQVLATPVGSSGAATPTTLTAAYLPVATPTSIGAVKPDNSSITVASDGTISATEAGITELTGDVTAGPGSGSQAATLNRVLLGWDVFSGAVATSLGNLIAAPRAAPISQCVLTVTASDASTALVFDIQQNGSSVFSSAPSVAAGTAAGTVLTFSLSGSSLPVAFKDVFGLNVTAGTSSWKFSVYLE